MRESKDNTLLNQYLREMRKEGFYCYYELKTARGPSFAFSKIEDVQDESLPALGNEGLIWKLSDEDSRRKPCDGFSAPPLPSFLVIKFGTTFCFLRYERIQEMRAAGQKSISYDEALALSTKVVHTSH
jgi:hypothetical protein